jgi:hypothetical protein
MVRSGLIERTFYGAPYCIGRFRRRKMRQSRHPLIDLFTDLRGFGLAARAVSQMMFDLPGLQLPELPREMSGKMSRNMSREHR